MELISVNLKCCPCWCEVLKFWMSCIGGDKVDWYRELITLVRIYFELCSHWHLQLYLSLRVNCWSSSCSVITLHSVTRISCVTSTTSCLSVARSSYATLVDVGTCGRYTVTFFRCHFVTMAATLLWEVVCLTLSSITCTPGTIFAVHVPVAGIPLGRQGKSMPGNPLAAHFTLLTLTPLVHWPATLFSIWFTLGTIFIFQIEPAGLSGYTSPFFTLSNPFSNSIVVKVFS